VRLCTLNRLTRLMGCNSGIWCATWSAAVILSNQSFVSIRVIAVNAEDIVLVVGGGVALALISGLALAGIAVARSAKRQQGQAFALLDQGSAQQHRNDELMRREEQVMDRFEAVVTRLEALLTRWEKLADDKRPPITPDSGT
jgi:hypothetical protein